MPLHVRIDDRLLHGQVSIGWVPVIRPSLIIVADDAAADDTWERETYLASEPEGVEVIVLALGEARRRLAAVPPGEVVLLLVRGPVELLRLVRAGLSLREAVMGGLHAGRGRIRIEEDLQISPEEASALSALTARGVRCYYQPLPTSPVSELPDLSALMEEEPRE